MQIRIIFKRDKNLLAQMSKIPNGDKPKQILIIFVTEEMKCFIGNIPIIFVFRVYISKWKSFKFSFPSLIIQ